MSQGDGVQEEDKKRGNIKCWPPETGFKTGLTIPLMALTLNKNATKLSWFERVY